MPCRAELVAAGGTAVGGIDHDVPFHVSANAVFPDRPTAMQNIALRHDTP
jgi:hypothetical protein